MNPIFLIGTVGKDAEVRQTSNGSFQTFSVACNKEYKKKDGEQVKETSWWNCIYNGEKEIKKGMFVAVVGEAKVNEYQNKEGQLAKSFNVVVRDISTNADVTKTVPSKIVSLIKDLRELFAAEEPASPKQDTVAAFEAETGNAEAGEEELPF